MIINIVVGVTNFFTTYIFFFLPHEHLWDYVMHFIVSLVGVLAIMFLLKFLNMPPRAALYIAIIITLFFGIVKEIVDIQTGAEAIDVAGDLIGDFLGVALGVALIFSLKATN